MADDEFSKLSDKALKEAVTSGAVIVATAVAGPGAGLVAGVGFATAFDWFERRAGGNDQSVKAAIFVDVGEQFRRLDEVIARLAERLSAAERKLDRQDMLTRDAVYSEFARGVSEAPTPEKREALVNATARQFDPTAGRPAVRGYWLRRVRELPDIELEVVKLLHAHGRLAFDGAVFAVSKTASVWIGERAGNPTRSEVVVLEVTALNMSKGSEPDQLLLRSHEQISLRASTTSAPFENKTTSLFGLTPSGEELAKFIAD